jgi:adenine-specific DNA-methyltransferase
VHLRKKDGAMNNKPKLELTWIGKGEQPKLEPRILIEDPARSHGHKNAQNMLIYGDNLLALKALEQGFIGKVKCIYIDPPYNTGGAFDHYDDSLEHSIWLGLMKPRLELLRSLLAEDGSIWISIDDDECHYLKVLCDEVFGRSNFVTVCLWQKIHSLKNDAKLLSVNHDYILVYAKKIEQLKINLLPRTEKMNARYQNPDNDERGPWQSGDLVANETRTKGNFEVKGPTGKAFTVPAGKHWVYSQDNLEEMILDNRVWFGVNGDSFPRQKRFLSEVQQGRKGDTWWTSDEVGHNQEAKREVKQFNSADVFSTPKPERLIQRILQLATQPGDLVLDSFLGSGTTAAVAMKMKRRWIGIELGEHCHSHCIPRLKQVCDGSDRGGISESVGWNGGDGFAYFYLAPSLLQKDQRDNWIISRDYNSNMLAAAMAKHEGFRFQPDESFYWKQGRSTEKDYIFTTTHFVSVEFVDTIHGEMKEDESLLICCTSFSKAADKYPNITIKKIPKMLLGRCEFGKEDYSLNIVRMPREDDEPDFVPVGPIASNKPKSKPKKDDTTGDLFAPSKGGNR